MFFKKQLSKIPFTTTSGSKIQFTTLKLRKWPKMSETSFTKEWTVFRRSEIKRENSVTISPLVEQSF